MKLRLSTALALSMASLGAAASAQLPQVPPVPPENPITESKRILGKMLFWEEQLSSDNTIACGTCHRFEDGGADPRFRVHPGADGLFTTPDDVFGSQGMVRSDADNDYLPHEAFGLLTQVTGRSAPSPIGAAFFGELFWDGRAPGRFVDPETGATQIASGGALESQAVAPVLNDVEMAHEMRGWNQVAVKLAEVTPMRLASDLPADVDAALMGGPSYPDLFTDAFGDGAITANRIARAIATYQRTLIPDQTPWDLFVAGDTGALTQNEQAGLALFEGAANCAQCHMPPLFSDGGYHNLGLRPIDEDPGRQNVTGNPADGGKFKTPSLRNAALRPRFMHNGRTGSMNAVQNLYAGGGGPFDENKDPLLVPLLGPGGNLDPQQLNQVFDFVEDGLVDPRVAQGLPPFDRPTLHSESQVPNPEPFGQDHPSPGAAPANIAWSPPNIINRDFKVGLALAEGGSLAMLGVSLLEGPMGQVVSGVPVHLDIGTLFLIPVLVEGTSPTEGYATFHADLENDPGLIGAQVFTQWFTTHPDPMVPVAATRGARFTIF